MLSEIQTQDPSVREKERTDDSEHVTTGSAFNTLKVKLKVSRNRSGVAQRVPGGLGSQIFMTFGT